MHDLARHPLGGPWACLRCRGDSPYATTQREQAQAGRDAERIEQIQYEILTNHINEEAHHATE
jgi:hypothetical protein